MGLFFLSPAGGRRTSANIGHSHMLRKPPPRDTRSRFFEAVQLRSSAVVEEDEEKEEESRSRLMLASSFLMHRTVRGFISGLAANGDPPL